MEQRDTEMGHFVEKNKTQNENRQGNKKMKHVHTLLEKTVEMHDKK